LDDECVSVSEKHFGSITILLDCSSSVLR
jgi:hypothetical protein